METEDQMETPTTWLRDGNLLYTLHEAGRRKGEPIMVNRLMITIQWDPKHATDEEGEALVQQVLAALSSAEQVDDRGSGIDQP